MATPVATFFSENAAVRVSINDLPLTGLRVLVRAWQLTEDALREDAPTYLKGIIDYTDPKADGEAYAGAWRSVNVTAGKIKDREGMWVIQTLAQNLLGNVFSYASLRACKEAENTYQATQYPYAVTAPENPRGGIYSASASFDPNTGTYSGSVTYKGFYAKINRFVSELGPFSAEITVEYDNSWSQVEPPAGWTGPGIYRASNSIAEACLYDGRLNYSYSRLNGSFTHASQRGALVDEDARVYRDWDGPINAPENPRGTVYSASSTLGEDGLYGGSLNYQQFGGYAIPSVRSRSPGSVTVGIDYIQWPVMPEALESGAGGIYRAQSAFTQAGMYNGDLSYQYATLTGIFSLYTDRGFLATDRRLVYERWNDIISAPVAPQGAIYSANSSLGDDNTYSGGIGYKVLSPYAISGVRGLGAVQSGTGIEYNAWRTQIVAPAFTAGVLYRANSSLGQAGTYEGSLTYDAFHPTAISSVRSRSPSSIVVGIEYQNWPVMPEAQAAGVGGIYRASSSFKNAGVYDGDLSYQYATLNGIFSHYSERGALTTDRRLVYERWNDIITAPLGPAGTIYGASCSLGDDNTYSGAMNYRVLSPYAILGVRSQSPTRVTVGIEYVAWPSHIQAPAAGLGGVYRASSSLGQGNVYSGDLSYQYSTGTGLFWHQRRNVGVERADALVYADWPAPVLAPDSPRGAIYSAQTSMGEDGLYSGVLDYQRTNSAYFTTAVARSFTGETTEAKFRNALSPMLPPASVPRGAMYRANFVYSDAQVYDGNLVYDNGGTPQQFMFVARQEASIYNAQFVYQNQDAKMDAPANGANFVYSASSSVGADGFYQNGMQYSGARTIEDGFSFPTRTGNVYVWKGSDVPAATVDALYTDKAAVYLATSGWDISLNRTRSPRYSGLYDYDVVARPIQQQADLGDAWSSGNIYINCGTNSNGKTVMLYKRLTTSRDTARDFINNITTVGSYNKVPVEAGHTTDVFPTSGGRWVGVVVLRQT